MSETDRVFVLRDERKGPAHECIIEEGQYRHDPNKKNYYTLKGSRYIGLEAVNWIKTTIKLKDSILEKPILFEIALDSTTRFCTPDFTCYFAPPKNYVLSENFTEVSIGDSKLPNLVAGVADATDVDFTEWTENEGIAERKKTRLTIHSILATDFYCLSNKGVKISTTFVDTKKHTNHQFIAGLIIAFLLSFCSDKTRINDCLDSMNRLFSSFDTGCQRFLLLQSFTIPASVIVAYIALVFSKAEPRDAGDKKTKCFFTICRASSNLCILILVGYLFFGWFIFPEAIYQVIKDCCSNTILLSILTILGLLLNSITIFYHAFLKKRRIIDYI